MAQLHEDLPALARAHIEIALVPAEPQPAEIRDGRWGVDQLEIETGVSGVDFRSRGDIARDHPALTVEARIEPVPERRAAGLPGPECAGDQQSAMRGTAPEKEPASQAEEREQWLERRERRQPADHESSDEECNSLGKHVPLPCGNSHHRSNAPPIP